jgi:adenine-specific DNA-methyltransferase
MFKEYALTSIYCENNILSIKKIPDTSIQLIITSPPYNIGKEYETKIDITSYINDQKTLINEFSRILKDNGSIAWQIGTYVDNGEIYPLDIYFYPIFKELGYKLRNRIIWQFNHGLHCKNRFSGRYETILIFSKSDEYTFNLDSVRVPQKEKGKKYFKGDKKGEFACNPLGKNPSDYWEILYRDWDNGVWKIPNVKSNHLEKMNHPCQFPIELCERIILALSNENDTILDPYMGVGSTLLASLLHDRNAIGIEIQQEYVNIAHKRIAMLKNGELKYRKMTQKIYEPSNNVKSYREPIHTKNTQSQSNQKNINDFF